MRASMSSHTMARCCASPTSRQRFRPRKIWRKHFAEVIRTGSFFHYPKHNPRSGNTAYLQDMSMWPATQAGLNTSP